MTITKFDEFPRLIGLADAGNSLLRQLFLESHRMTPSYLSRPSDLAERLNHLVQR